MSGGKRPGAGRPKQEATTTVSFRVTKKLKADAKKKHGRTLNKKATTWLSDITYDKKPE